MEKEMNMKAGNGNVSQPTMITTPIGRDQYDQLVQYGAEQGTTAEAVVDEALTEFLDEEM
jgi:hypothetical protein